ncbi:MAG TPA: homoserine kinase, partial [Chitinophagaceae bacterium]
RIIKKNVALKEAVIQWGNVAGLVAGLYREDYELISRSMQDVIIEPTRAILIPDFYQLKALALQEGALGFGISGSGPSLFALSRTEAVAREVVEKVKAHLLKTGIESEGYVSTVNAEGPRVMG